MVGKSIKNLSTLPRKVCQKATIVKTDALTMNSDLKYDLIIGNPPYFEFSPDLKIKTAYSEVLNGRSNIFSMFIKLGLDNLKNDGYLAFVVPPGMNNGAYFKKLRSYIQNSAEIVYLKILESPSMFHHAQQQVMVLILKKAKNTEKYVFSKNGITIFTTEKSRLKQAFAKNTTLFELGFKVQTGSIIWNQNREHLSNSEKDATILVWGRNISKNKLVINNTDKPQFIKKVAPMYGPAILVNRIIGSGKSINLKAAVIKKGEKFLAENHVNIIFPPENIDGKPVSLAQLRLISRQISSDEIAQIIRQISGNTQLSKTELWKLLPIKLS